jgi:hypothetical protein
MRMFFCHKPYMMFDCCNAKNALGSQAVRAAKAAKGFMAAALSVLRSRMVNGFSVALS